MNHKLLLQNANVVLPDRLARGASVLVADGRIESVSEFGLKSVTADSTIKLDGVTLYPGFIDVHIHGAVGADTMEATSEDLVSVGRFLARQGVTAWLPTLVPASTDGYKRAVQSIEKGAIQQNHFTVGEPANPSDEYSPGARILGVHYEGPFVNEAQCGALRREHFRKFATPADVDALPLPHNSNAIKMMTLAPEIDGGIELIEELARRNWIVSIGHTRADVETLDRAFAAGTRHITHFMNAMPSLHHRSPGPVGWGLFHQDVTYDVIADGIHIDPLVLQLLCSGKRWERMTLISDAIAAAGMGDGDYNIWGDTIAVRNGRTRNVRGSIAGSVITMLDAVRMMSSLGVSEVELARMAAGNPARLLRIEDDCGSIVEGKRADLVALDREGHVRLTIIGGEVVVVQSE